MAAISRTSRRSISGVALRAVALAGRMALIGYLLVALRIGSVSLPRTVYTPVELRRALAQAPAVWLGRTLWVRARAVRTFVWSCLGSRWYAQLCVLRQPSFADPTVDTGDARLALALPPEPPLLTLARRLPLVGAMVERLVPPTHGIAWGRIALYHIQLTLPATCAEPGCVAARIVPVP